MMSIDAALELVNFWIFILRRHGFDGTFNLSQLDFTYPIEIFCLENIMRLSFSFLTVTDSL